MTLQQLKYVLMVADKRSMNQAAAALFISQPSLSAAVRDLEEEIGLTIFMRSNKGITVTAAGNEFLGYARQLMAQYALIDARYLSGAPVRKRFSVSMQHYSFAVQAFMRLVERFGMDEYEFAVHETKTYEVIEHVRRFDSELGVLYRNAFNEQVLMKVLREKGLSFTPLFDCHAYVYLWKGHPLAGRDLLTLDDLAEYPCLSFEQGENNAFYLAEEILSTYHYKRVIKADDRATCLNMMRGLNAFTLCSGIICAELNGGDYTALPLDSDETMTIGYIKQKAMPLSPLGELYVEELKAFKDQAR